MSRKTQYLPLERRHGMSSIAGKREKRGVGGGELWGDRRGSVVGRVAADVELEVRSSNDGGDGFVPLLADLEGSFAELCR